MQNNDYINREAASKVITELLSSPWATEGTPMYSIGINEALSLVRDMIRGNAPNGMQIPAADVVPAAAYNAAVDTIRKLLCSEYGDSCQFCVWHNIPDAHCARIGGSGGWCCENARWIGVDDLQQTCNKLATDKQDRCKLPASYQQVNGWIPVEERLPEQPEVGGLQ